MAQEDPDKVLGAEGFDYHLGKLAWGTPEQREAFVQKYGYEASLKYIDLMIEATPKNTDREKEWHEDILDYKKDLLSRQGY